MGAFDNFVSKIQGDQNIDDPIVRQQLKQAFKDLAKTDEGADYFDNQQSIPKAYFNEKMLPELTKMDTTTRGNLLKVLQDRKNDLASLVGDIHSTMTFASRKGMVAQELRTTIPGTIGTTLLDTKHFIDSVAGLQNDKEREQALLMEVYDRAKRVQAKFDNYVWKGDGKQYGSGGGTIQNLMSGDDVVEFHGEEGKNQARAEVEDTHKDKIEDILQMLTDKAKNPTDTSVDFSAMGGKNINLGNKINQLAEMASYLDALERGIDDAEQGWVGALASLPADIAGTLIDWVKPSNITNAVSSLSTVVIAVVAWRKGWISKEKLKGLLGKGTPSTAAEGSIPESKDKTVTIKGKEYYNPKSDSYKELETSVRSEIEKLKNPSTGTAAISEAEANTRLAKALRFLEGYKTDFLNGHAPYDKTEFGVKLNKIVKGETIIIPTEGTLRERVLGTAKKVATSPLKSAKEAKALVGEGISGKGWNLSARMAAITSAENLTAGSKNEPFKIEGVTDGYTFKGDHARVSAEMKEIDNLLKERAAVEKWIELEGKITAQQKIIDEMTKRANDLKAASSYFRTTSQTTSQPTNNGIANQTNTNQDLTDAAKQVEDAITKATEEKARLQASAGNSTEYKRVFIDKPKYTVSGGVQQQVGVTTSLEQANREFARISREITAKVNSSYNTAHGVTTGNPNKFRENERGININKFLKIIAESMSKK